MSRDPEAGRRRAAVARVLMAADPRLKVLLTFLLGLMTWQAGLAGVLFYGLALGLVLFLLGDVVSANRSVVRTYAAFVLLWMAVKFLFEILDGAGPAAAALRATDLGLRLLVLLLLGLALALSTSPRSLGLAAAWLLRPVLGKRAWRAALSLSLMVHFLPLVWQTFSTVQRTIALRARSASWPRRLNLMAQASLRALSQKTWDQTVALAARGLDAPEAWTCRFDFRPREWAVGLAAAGLGLAAAWA